jgi:predicted tellurium resistance membrane protein TerC
MEIFLHPEAWFTLLMLTFLEIVLGIDNIIFISIVSDRLPKAQQKKARFIGLTLALAFRIMMLLGITYIIGFTQPLVHLLGHDFSGKDAILFAGGLFLIIKSTMEIKLKFDAKEQHIKEKKAGLSATIVQIVLLDIVFSFDSILTAVGVTREVLIMIIAVIISIAIMMFFAGYVSDFINKYPTLQILALAFLVLIGIVLLGEAFHLEIPKGYVYSAVLFSLIVEWLNIRLRRRIKH